ncbi:MAG: hypothetical protein ACPGRE_09500 [Flavobacteriaceae bacterium]
MKKFLVLFILFVLPLGAYLFIIQGKINFEKLPVLSEKTGDITVFHTAQGGSLDLSQNISVVLFVGSDLQRVSTGVLNLNEIVYRKLVKYKEFEIVVIAPQGTESDVLQLKKDLNFMVGTDLNKWKFVYGSPEQITSYHKALHTTNTLDDDYFDKDVYIIDKNARLRGRFDDQGMVQFGYNIFQAATLKNELLDDVKVVFYEYNSALKEFDNQREI